MFRERHLTFAAVRTPGCEVEPVATLTLFRQVLGCLGGGLGDTGGDLTFRLDTVAADGETPPVEPVPPAVASDLLSIAQGSIRLPG